MKKLLTLVLTTLVATSCFPLSGGQKQVKTAPPPPPPRMTKPSPKERAEGYYQIGISYLRLGEIPLALNYLFKAKKLSPKDPKIYNAIGVAFLKRGDLLKAEENFRKAIKLKKDFSEGYLNLGIVYEERGDYQKAREYYNKALSNPLYLTPEVAYYRLALLDLREGKKKDAEKNLLRALRNNPDYIPAYIELAKLSESEGRTERAKEIYFRLIGLYPKLQYPYCALGEIYFKEDKRRLSRKYFKKCMEVDPNSELGIKAKLKLEELNE